MDNDEKVNGIRNQILLAVDNNDLEMVKYWIAFIDDLRNLSDSIDYTLLDAFRLAVDKNYSEIAQFLANYDYNGMLIIDIIFNNDIVSLRYLMDELKHEDTNDLNELLDMTWEVQWLNNKSGKEIMAYLIENGADPNLLLFRAVDLHNRNEDNGVNDLIIFALKQGANVYAQNNERETILDILTKYKCESYNTIKLIQNYPFRAG